MCDVTVSWDPCSRWRSWVSVPGDAEIVTMAQVPRLACPRCSDLASREIEAQAPLEVLASAVARLAVKNPEAEPKETGLGQNLRRSEEMLGY